MPCHAAASCLATVGPTVVDPLCAPKIVANHLQTKKCACVCLQASGEYMLSTTVQASPDCCLSNLMFKADKHGSILSTAAFMEVLEDNGDMQVCAGAYAAGCNGGNAGAQKPNSRPGLLLA